MDSLLDKLTIPTHIRAKLAAGCPHLISCSGGKDSDAMLKRLLMLYEREDWNAHNITMIYADEGRMIQRENLEHCQQQANLYGLPLIVVKQSNGDLLDTITHRILSDTTRPGSPSPAAEDFVPGHRKAAR